MAIFGVSILLISGTINFILLLFQLLSGLHTIKVKIKTHKNVGRLFFIAACLHAALAILSQ